MKVMNNDKIFLDSYLLLLKSTVEVYVHGTLESSNKKVRNLDFFTNSTKDVSSFIVYIPIT